GNLRLTAGAPKSCQEAKPDHFPATHCHYWRNKSAKRDGFTPPNLIFYIYRLNKGASFGGRLFLFPAQTQPRTENRELTFVQTQGPYPQTQPASSPSPAQKGQPPLQN